MVRILSIDWWKKHIGLAYAADDNQIIFPLGTLQQSPTALFDLAHLLMQHRIDTIIIGYPRQVSWVQAAIDAFIVDLQMVISPDTIIHRVNEDYSSVEANALLGVYKKTAEEDTLAATVLLRRWFAGEWV
jgi:RNase H-fold protein (predicted Holliday junction resolvase)